MREPAAAGFLAGSGNTAGRRMRGAAGESESRGGGFLPARTGPGDVHAGTSSGAPGVIGTGGRDVAGMNINARLVRTNGLTGQSDSTVAGARPLDENGLTLYS
jgi:hypothetical protein